MKKISILLFLVISSFYLSQKKIGLISEINPQAAQTDVKVGIIHLKPNNVYPLDLNVINVIQDYFTKEGLEVNQFFDFNFELLKNKNPIHYSKSENITTMLTKYCDDKKIDKLIILKNNDGFKNNNITTMFNNLENQVGAVTLPKSSTKLIIYYNFLIIEFDKNNQDFKVSYTNYDHEKNKDFIFIDNESKEINQHFKDLVIEKVKSIITSFLKVKSKIK